MFISEDIRALRDFLENKFKWDYEFIIDGASIGSLCSPMLGKKKFDVALWKVNPSKVSTLEFIQKKKFYNHPNL